MIASVGEGRVYWTVSYIGPPPFWDATGKEAKKRKHRLLQEVNPAAHSKIVERVARYVHFMHTFRF